MKHPSDKRRGLLPAAVLPLLALLVTTGCATVRDAREAQKEASRLAGERVMTYEETGLPTNGPVPIAALEQAALKTSPAVLQARQSIIIAQLALLDIKSSYIPTIDASAGYTLSTANIDPHDQSGHMDGKFAAGATLNMLVYDFGKTKAATRQAISSLISAERTGRMKENEVLYQVRRACYELKRQAELRDVATETAEIYAEHLRQAQARLDVGAVNSYAVTKANVDWAQSVLAAVTASNRVHTAQAGLTLALGLDQMPAFAIDDSKVRSYEGLGVDELMEIARTNAPSLASLRAAAEGASAYVDKTVADLYPSLGVQIRFAAEGEDSPFLWNLVGGADLTQSIFAAGRKRRAIDAAVAQLRIARSRVAAEELVICNHLTLAVLDSIRSRQQLDVAIQSEKMAQENFEIATQRYKVGTASELERSDAQVALASAKASVVSARYDYLDSQVQISRLVGE